MESRGRDLPGGQSIPPPSTEYFAQKKIEFEAACLRSDPPSADACFSLGEWHQLIAKDVDAAKALYRANCAERGHPNSCFNYAQLVAGTDHTEARSFFQKSCEESRGQHGQACSAWASMMLLGLGGPKDVQAGRARLESLCATPMNDARACVRLGALYLQTTPDVEKDSAKAFAYMKRACEELGHPNGCQVLAVMYKKGDGVPVDMNMFEKYKTMTLELAKVTAEKMGKTVISPDGSS